MSTFLGGGDLSYKGEAYNKLQDKLGQSLTADEWEKFLELQMDGARGNNLDSLQPSGRPAVKDWKKNRKKAQQQIVQEWRSTNKINQLEKTYQTHWPTVRERLVAEDRNKIETMDTAEVSAYLGEKRVLTPGTTTFTIMEGAAEKKQFSVGESFPNKPGENRRSKGLMKTILAITEEQHVRQGTFTIAENNRELAHRILRSEDTNLKRAFLDIYNAQTYPTSDKYGERIYLKPIYSGDPRHINHIIQQSGISPAYGKSVYRVSKADIKPDETVQVTMGRIYRNGLSQLSGNNLLPVETDLNSADFEKRFDSLVNHFTKINFPGASDQEVRERLEEGVPLMLITP